MNEPFRLEKPPTTILLVSGFGFACDFLAITGVLAGAVILPLLFFLLGLAGMGLMILLEARVELDDQRCRRFMRFHDPNGLRFIPIPTLRETAAHIWTEVLRAAGRKP